MMEPRLRGRAYNLLNPGLSPGPLNAITDVPGVAVGHRTLHDDHHQPPIHTGVTVIIPHPGDLFNEKLFAAVHTINGYGKAAGFEQVREMGTLEAPIALTNTLCVGRVWDGLVSWMLEHHPEIGARGPSVNPLVGECNDGRLNDLRGRHVKADDVMQALTDARSGPVAEGSVGGGTGMVCYGFKGGVGTASRQVGEYVLGGLLVANFGRREQLTIRGVPVGRMMTSTIPEEHPPLPGSVMIVLATNAPLTDRQLSRLARRADLGLARTGSTVSSGSGDFAIAFSTAQKVRTPAEGSLLNVRCLPEPALDLFFQAVVEVVEESVLNALCQAEPVMGPEVFTIPALPIEQVQELLIRSR
jgi:D-aminopeptidase